MRCRVERIEEREKNECEREKKSKRQKKIISS